MTPDEARPAMEATLYSGETIEAFGMGVETKKPAVQLPGEYVTGSWIAFTRSRLIEVLARSPAQPRSTHLRMAKRLELRRSFLGGHRLYFDPSGAPQDMSLSVLRVDRSLASMARPLIAARMDAPDLPVESTRFVQVTPQVDDQRLVALMGAMGAGYVELRCERCSGLCGSGVKKVEVFEHCSGCLRDVVGPVGQQ